MTLFHFDTSFFYSAKIVFRGIAAKSDLTWYQSVLFLFRSNYKKRDFSNSERKQSCFLKGEERLLSNGTTTTENLKIDSLHTCTRFSYMCIRIYLVVHCIYMFVFIWYLRTTNTALTVFLQPLLYEAMWKGRGLPSLI